MKELYKCEFADLFPDATDEKPPPGRMSNTVENTPLSNFRLSYDGFDIRDLLYRLGITEKYVGFFHTSYAVYLSIHQPERLLLVTKWLYPDVAKHYNTNWRNVERTIRTVASVAWQLRPEMLSFLANHTLIRRPSNTQFISILAHYLQDAAGETVI